MYPDVSLFRKAHCLPVISPRDSWQLCTSYTVKRSLNWPSMARTAFNRVSAIPFVIPLNVNLLYSITRLDAGSQTSHLGSTTPGSPALAKMVFDAARREAARRN
jgi:hypothetical protein